MKINTLIWDSDFFAKKIGEIIIEENPLEIDPDESFDLIVLKQPSDFTVRIKHFRETFKETKIIFSKNIIHKNINDFSDIADTDETLIQSDFLKNLAYESGKMSRFLLDPLFGEKKFRELYDIWITNSLNKKFAIKTFYIVHQFEAIGFVTLQKSENRGKIGLIATHPKHQGKGIGKKLLAYTENYCLENDLYELEIPTQLENKNACGFYKNMGYQIKNETIIKHFWRYD